ncbi:Pleiotropic drug resistance ABC transporter protein [Mycena venus]|uniref:Pleiotropic drug resistance ABC transporter protein n=1 Tax=Mycena venus TaxID=2733690 RepID=A0A8H7DFF0_9AGAR|nr:Pleiotropic drug resistance ABC transporter protein [Mycena venus]
MDAPQTTANTERSTTSGAPPADTGLTSRTSKPNPGKMDAASATSLALRLPESIEAQPSVSERTSILFPSDLSRDSEREYGSRGLFRNSEGSRFAGGQLNWVAGDFTPDSGLPKISSIYIADEESEVAIYCSQLRRQKRGFPLHVPGPQETSSKEYRKRGVAIGDVGRITPEGCFDFFFNIYLPADHPIHNNDVPEHFLSVTSLRTPRSVSPGFSVPHCHSAYSGFPGGGFGFNCRPPQGAILALPYGSRLEKLLSLQPMRIYAATHAKSWFKYINGRRGRELDGPVYLVTGCEKAQSWGMASFHNVGETFELAFTPVPAGVGQYVWRGNPAQKKSYHPSTIIDAPWNQTMFIHALTISPGTGFWAWLLGRIQIGDIVDMQSPLGSAGGNLTSHVPGSSLLSWVAGLSRGRAITM